MLSMVYNSAVHLFPTSVSLSAVFGELVPEIFPLSIYRSALLFMIGFLCNLCAYRCM